MAAWDTIRSVEILSTRIELIEAGVERLSSVELSELRDWFLERDQERRNQQIGRGAVGGRLGPLFEPALEANRRRNACEV